MAIGSSAELLEDCRNGDRFGLELGVLGVKQFVVLSWLQSGLQNCGMS